MRMYELTEEYRQFLSAVEAGEIPEEAIADTLDALRGGIEEKADSIACLIKELEAESSAISEEAKRLSERATRKKKEAEKLRSYLFQQLLESGCDDVETSRVKITFRRSSAVKIDDETAFIEWAQKEGPEYITVKSSVTPNKDALKKAIKRGEEIPFASVEERKNMQIS